MTKRSTRRSKAEIEAEDEVEDEFEESVVGDKPDFFWKRTCFRKFFAYYKKSFKPHLKECDKSKKLVHVLKVMEDYSLELQPGLLEKLKKINKSATETFIDKLKMLIFCHRHSKTHEYITRSPIEWSVVRDPLYKYSRDA